MMAQLQAITAHLHHTRSSTVPSTTRSTGPPTTSIDTPPTDRPRASEQEKEVGKLLRASIGKFSGKDRRPHTLLNFLAQFVEYVGFMRLAGREKSSAFSAMLSEDAVVWYRALDRSYNWTDLKQEFLRRFRDPRAEQNARSKLHQLEQTGPAKKYTEEFKRLCACIADLTESDKLQTYLNGLRADLRMHLAVLKVTTFEQAVHSAEELDEIAHQERARLAKKSQSPKAEKVSRVTEKLRDRKGGGDDAKAKERRELRAKGACYLCKQPGHMQSACPKKAERVAVASTSSAPAATNDNSSEMTKN